MRLINLFKASKDFSKTIIKFYECLINNILAKNKKHIFSNFIQIVFRFFI
jgi:hypothetical protein